MKIRKTKIQSFFELPEDYSFNENAIRYFGSLTPSWDLLKEVKHINLILEIDRFNNNGNLGHHNPVNSHLFKPKFEYERKSSHLYCYVASSEILAHTLKGLYFADYFSTKIDFQISTEDRRNRNIKEYIKNWVINDNIVICRIESFLLFLRILLLFELKVDIEDIQKFVVLTELSRVSVEVQDKLKAYVKNMELKYRFNLEEVFSDYYSIEPQETLSPYILATNVKIMNKSLTLVPLTWGYSLTFELLDSILNKNKKIKRLAVCGGVGYIGNEDVSVDDIFIPTKILTGDREKGYKIKKVKNGINHNDALKLFSKRVSSGTIRSVRPTVNIFSNTSSLGSRINEIDAFDMELESIIDVLKKYPKISTGFIYYIMDKPNEGLGLGATYYNENFLKKLLSAYNRGKFYCFEKIISFIEENGK